jgi:hypothetical protein
MELNPSDSGPHYALAGLSEREGSVSEATVEWRIGLRLEGDEELLNLFDKTFRSSGYSAAKRAVNQTLLARLVAVAKTSYVSPRHFVELYLEIGDRENALRCLDTAFAEHSSFLVQISDDPHYDSLRTDPRFRAMRRRMGAPGAD